ncbi:MAG: hypothetical protein N2Z62_03510 [Rhodobacteraceae bacterium]|nr:hypothetical protein [Paracoccaceae bacterium]
MRRAGLLLAALLAQPAAAGTVEHCRALWIGHAGALALAGLGARPPEAIAVEDGRCVARDLAGDPFGDGRGLAYPRAVWSGGAAGEGGAAFTLDLEVVPAGQGALPGRPAGLRDRARLALALAEDAAAGVLAVRAEIAFEGRNGVTVALSAPGLSAAGTAPLAARLAGAELGAIAAELRGDGRLAERWAALFPPLERPGPADRARAAAVLRAVPAAAMDAASREAALALIDDWPDLRGRARIELEAPGGFRPAMLAGAGIAPDPARWLAAALTGARLRIAYGP